MPKPNKSLDIVVLHGWTLNPGVQDKWQPFLKLLEKAGFKVHFWPLPGLAEEPKKALHLTDYVDWLADQTKSLEKFLLLGHSFGGQLATRFTKLHPEKVSRLVLIDSSGILDHSLPKKLKRTVFRTLAKVGKTFTSSSVLRRLLYQLARERDYYEAGANQRKTMRNILTDEVVDDLPAIQAPTLVIWGEHDRMTPLKLAETFAENIPNSQFVLIKAARHSPMYTHPEEVLSAIKNFLEK